MLGLSCWANERSLLRVSICVAFPAGTAVCFSEIIEKAGWSGEVSRTITLFLFLSVSPSLSMTLDPRTANPHLFLSLDQKTVTYLDHAQPLLDNPERFDAELFVLGCQAFCSGKHSWVVNVEQGQNWAIGIAQESVRRKGSLSLSPQQGIWAVQQCWGQLQALTSCWTTLFLLRKPRRIRVDLDYEGGWVAFFDAELDAPIFTFPPTSFKQERIRPWFWVASGSQLTLCP